MATIFPPFRSLAPRTALRWKADVAGLAVIDGYPSNYAGIAGGEQVTLQRAGGGPSVITFLAGDNTRAAVIARINATFAAFASVNGNGGIRLSNATSLSVNSILPAVFDKIGLPVVARDRGAGYVATYQPDVTAVIDRVDLISEPVAIPDGANRLAVWLKFLGTGGDTSGVGAQVLFGFSNGVDGEVTTLLGNPSFANSLVPVAVVGDFDDLQAYVPRRDLYYAPIPGQNQPTTSAIEVEVPPGATKFFVVLLVAQDPGSETRTPYPCQVSGGVIPGVR